MKKIYITPAIGRIETYTANMVASSPGIGIDKDKEVDAGDSFGREQRNDWENIWTK